MDRKFVEEKLAKLYPTTAHFIIMQEWVGLNAGSCVVDSESMVLHILQDPDAALALAREYKEWGDKQKEG